MRPSTTILFLLIFYASSLSAADRSTAGEFITEPATLVSLGSEWRIGGDDNRNAQVAVTYRKQGEQAWKPGPPLLRIGNERINENALQYVTPNGFAGSVFDLDPATMYDVRFVLSDADGVEGQAERVVSVRTRAEPMPAIGGRVYHVTNYSSSDYNGFRPNEGAEFSFEWSSPARELRSNFPGEPGKLGVQEQTKFEAAARERRRFRTLREFSDATGQDAHSVLVDYDVFVRVAPPGPDPRTLYKPADFDFQLRPGSAAVDAGVRLLGINDDFSDRAPDLGAYEAGRPVPHYGPRP